MRLSNIVFGYYQGADFLRNETGAGDPGMTRFEYMTQNYATSLPEEAMGTGIWTMRGLSFAHEKRPPEPLPDSVVRDLTKEVDTTGEEAAPLADSWLVLAVFFFDAERRTVVLSLE